MLSSMITIIWMVMMISFVLATIRCGKSIEKRSWSESVADFLIALGIVLIEVKNAPPI